MLIQVRTKWLMEPTGGEYVEADMWVGADIDHLRSAGVLVLSREEFSLWSGIMWLGTSVCDELIVDFPHEVRS